MQHPRDLASVKIPCLRTPLSEDGADVWELVRSCKPLDENSMYCNMIQCDHFSETCVLAELRGEVVGWISAYVLPDDPDTLFIWQVAVSENARGMGLGTTMLQEILERDACEGVRRIQTTITADNEASWALFRKFGRLQGSPLDIQPHYKKSSHFQNRHQTENLVTIPLAESLANAA
ncbi:diaminobutyrate acetyltransferase [Algicella marina]|uniref:L-2,4-diaminobutyric acid acetyltransferase n=1 Tax=Algicella marina TaxID=2683284 RepID=A0A6P1SU15_9RHOB|nr:diaminobutyrate acetyltransferase [Algicella marina]QHQ34184.1 diaminobutyrate acetyltransferase [Algicella marina]